MMYIQQQYMSICLLLDLSLLMPYSLVTKCGWPQSNAAWGILGVLMTYKVSMLLTGLFIAYKSRVIHNSVYDERIEIGYAI